MVKKGLTTTSNTKLCYCFEMARTPTQSMPTSQARKITLQIY